MISLRWNLVKRFGENVNTFIWLLVIITKICDGAPSAVISSALKKFIRENQSEFLPRSVNDISQNDISTTMASVFLVDPALDGRVEIANYNRFMDEIFQRMNLAIKAKQLDPMDLRLLPNTNMTDKTPRLEKQDDSAENISDTSNKLKAWLFGMSTLRRTGDVSIFFYPEYRTIQCPFALGPLELRVLKLVTVGEEQKHKVAKAITETMFGYMDLKIDAGNGSAHITDVVFDDPGYVDVQGNIKRRSNVKYTKSPYRLVLASNTKQRLKKAARLVAHPH